jgi:hypothetical protein|tara:strand:+ start:43 stop:378 length:336 start_codon:yes stop_codon:yes gene_type:complete
MGLKTDIFDALKKNIEPSNPGENYEFNDGGKLDTLAQDLTNAIVNFIQAQTFTITKLNATQLNVPVITPTGPGTAAKVTVKVDENSQAVDNPLSGAESMTSEVKLKRAIEV